jgi:SM-20-related protein
MLDLKAIEAVTVNEEPWQWAVVEDVFPADDNAVGLCREFPEDGFRWFFSDSGHKRFRYWGRFLVEPGSDSIANPDDLTPRWRAFAEEVLLSPEYRQAVGNAIGRDLSGAEMEATFWRYDPGCWFSAHVGSSDRIVNQVIYFNEEWSPEDGGYLRILASDDMDDAAAQIQPLLGRSVLIVRSDGSWHAIDPVSLHRGPSRQTVVVSFRTGA